MKTLIFSDTHLTCKFDEDKFIFLRKIIDSSDQVIINGDFWDAWFTNFDNFVTSKWNKLFPLLLKRKAIYLYGNHDPAEKCDSRVNLFSAKTGKSYDLIFPPKIYHIEHGHKILKGKRSKFLETYGLLLDKVDRSSVKKIFYNFLHFLEYLGYKLIGTSLMTESKVAKRSNEIIKQTNQGKRFLICGDTHCAEMDINGLFANSGCINYGGASFLLINDGEITLHRESY